MNRKPFEDPSLACTLAARRRIERRCKTFEGLCAYLYRLEQEPFPTPRMKRIAAKARLRPIRASAKPFDQGEIVTRCRRVRDEMDARLGTLDKAFARLEELARLRKRRGVKTAKARAHGKVRPVPREWRTRERQASP
jgi:hypothetical protein